MSDEDKVTNSSKNPATTSAIADKGSAQAEHDAQPEGPYKLALGKYLKEESLNDGKKSRINGLLDKSIALNGILKSWNKKNPLNRNKAIRDYCKKIRELIEEIRSEIIKEINEPNVSQANQDLASRIEALQKNDPIVEKNYKEIRKLKSAIRYWEEQKNQSPPDMIRAIDDHIEALKICIVKMESKFDEQQNLIDAQQVEATLIRNRKDIRLLKSLYDYWSNQGGITEKEQHLNNIYQLIKNLEKNNRDILIESTNTQFEEGHWVVKRDTVQNDVIALRKQDANLKKELPSRIGIENLLLSAYDEKKEHKSSFPFRKTINRTSSKDPTYTVDEDIGNELFRPQNATVFCNGKVVNNLNGLRAAVSSSHKGNFENALKYYDVSMLDTAASYIQQSIKSAQPIQVTPRTTQSYFTETENGFIFESVCEDYRYSIDGTEYTIPGRISSVYEYKNEESDPGFTWKTMDVSNSLLEKLVNGKENSVEITKEDLEAAQEEENETQDDFTFVMRHFARLKASLTETHFLKPIVSWLYNRIEILSKQHTDVADFELLTRAVDRIIELTMQLFPSTDEKAQPQPPSESKQPDGKSRQEYKVLEQNQDLLDELHEKYDNSFTIGFTIFLLLIGIGLTATGIGAFAGLIFTELAVEAMIGMFFGGAGSILLSRFFAKDIEGSQKKAELSLKQATAKPLITSRQKTLTVVDEKPSLFAQVTSQKNPNDFQATEGDKDRSLAPKTLRSLFDSTNKKEQSADSQNDNLQFYQIGRRLLISPVYANESQDLNKQNKATLQSALEKVSTGINKPKEIIIPVVEKKNGLIGTLVGYFSETEHIKTLHIKNISYGSDGNVSSYSVDYYDSKSSYNNYVFPSDNVKNIVAQNMGSDAVAWNDINPTTEQPHQPYQNQSDCGYWVYVWSCGLLNRDEPDFNYNNHFPNEAEMKLLHIARLITELKDPNEGPKKNFIDKAKELFELIMKKPDNDPKKADAINVLYKEMKRVKDNAANSYKEKEEDGFTNLENDEDATASIYDTGLIEKTIADLGSEKKYTYN